MWCRDALECAARARRRAMVVEGSNGRAGVQARRMWDFEGQRRTHHGYCFYYCCCYCCCRRRAGGRIWKQSNARVQTETQREMEKETSHDVLSVERMGICNGNEREGGRKLTALISPSPSGQSKIQSHPSALIPRLSHLETSGIHQAPLRVAPPHAFASAVQSHHTAKQRRKKTLDLPPSNATNFHST
ncbi:hypothetical protein OIDMADRAFT_26765 [Oidiodendron maius Zn]|uniref:Uncharacterized protein n=1 Tax=Oidiodendron maius (strain Zn) TaxID=913774 RepID=A0A0C3HPE9_OIDMZ|nr:hypothetical protein OIDMADRAFT_26765 [Oidiodendron maius Zn]